MMGHKNNQPQGGVMKRLALPTWNDVFICLFLGTAPLSFVFIVVFKFSKVILATAVVKKTFRDLLAIPQHCDVKPQTIILIKIDFWRKDVSYLQRITLSPWLICNILSFTFLLQSCGFLSFL